MAVAFDKITEHAFTTDTSFSVTPVGTPRGVLVLIGTNGASASQIDSVTYGGQALSQPTDAVGVDTSVELLTAEAWFLGTGIPTGTQTVAINETGGTAKTAWVITLTAAGDTAVEDAGNNGQNQDDPSVTLTTGASVETYVAALLMSGFGTAGDITAGSGFTLLDQNDLGQQVASVMDIDTNDPGSNVTATFVTSASEDVAMVAVAIKEVVGATAYELDCQPGPFTVTGAAATLLAARVVSSDPGAFAVTGAAATLAGGWFVSADPGAYTVTGVAATTAGGFVTSADPGAFAVTGTDATLEHEAAGAYEVDAAPGTFAVTGADAAFLTDRVLSVDTGSYAITGFDASLDVEVPGAYTLNAEIGAYAVTGTAASVIATRLFNAEPATYTITGNQAQVGRELTISAQPGSITLTGVAATFLRTLVLSADTGTYTITGTAAELRTEGQAPNMDAILTGWIAGPAHGFTGGGSSGRLRTPTTGSIA